MNIHSRALLVHLFTATGAIFAMLAMLAAAEERWDMMFLWLVVAFFVDGIDGPLARKYNVKTNAPEFDGVLLDLIIDYLTYVLEHAGVGAVCPVAAVVGIAGAGDGSGSDHVRPAQVRAPCSDRALARGYIADGAGLDLLCRMGRLGRFPPAKLGTLGSGHHQSIPNVCRRGAAIPVRSQGLNRRPAINITAHNFKI